MQVSELRIGNLVTSWILGKDREWEININDLSEIASNIHHDYKPIEITEELLISFGFENENGLFYLKEPNFTWLWIAGNLSRSYIYSSNNNQVYLGEVIYAHQLQNLYHSLTGTELIRS